MTYLEIDPYSAQSTRRLRPFGIYQDEDDNEEKGNAGTSVTLHSSRTDPPISGTADGFGCDSTSIDEIGTAGCSSFSTNRCTDISTSSSPGTAHHGIPCSARSTGR
ncbi:hypothetical protein UY3_14542 [Chelonia mydas]|uniref:Uncharacterized protein n=1 Tax=Chelonia mydas TaxID=8469 RepID=M7AZ20_CHEMY|nr:hypothetical protein UY3_14542 [Chelonia mydas]